MSKNFHVIFFTVPFKDFKNLPTLLCTEGLRTSWGTGLLWMGPVELLPGNCAQLGNFRVLRQKVEHSADVSRICRAAHPSSACPIKLFLEMRLPGFVGDFRVEGLGQKRPPKSRPPGRKTLGMLRVCRIFARIFMGFGAISRASGGVC